jgi:anti-sigma B factor antagonist
MLAKMRTVGAVDVVELSGKITIGEGEAELRKEVQELIDGGHKKILLGLEKVSFMDSAGLGELVACYKRAMEKGGTIKILRPSGKVADLLSLTKITEIFEIFEDEGEAIASF